MAVIFFSYMAVIFSFFRLTFMVWRLHGYMDDCHVEQHPYLCHCKKCGGWLASSWQQRRAHTLVYGTNSTHCQRQWTEGEYVHDTSGRDETSLKEDIHHQRRLRRDSLRDAGWQGKNVGTGRNTGNTVARPHTGKSAAIWERRLLEQRNTKQLNTIGMKNENTIELIDTYAI